MPSITIDPRYWQTVKKEYSNWQFAWAREAFQNAVDAGASRIDVKTTEVDDDKVRVVITDNGCGMSKDTLLKRFLAIGGSFKANGGTGGFGVAKNLLAFAQHSYTIHTGNIMLEGIGSEYEIDENYPVAHKGVTLSVVMDKKESEYSFRSDNIHAQIKKWAAWSTVKGCIIYLNGDRLPTLGRLPRKPKAQLDWADIYVHRKDDSKYSYKTRVRINGQFMFDVWSDACRHVTVEIRGSDSQKFLTANRDGLTYKYREKLTKFIAQLFQDPRKIQETERDEIDIYRGSDGKLRLPRKRKVRKLSIGKKRPKPARPVAPKAIAAEAATVGPAAIGEDCGIGHKTAPITQGEFLPPAEFDWAFTEIPLEVVRDGLDVIVINNLNRDVPDKYLPGTMSNYAAKLLKRWIELLKFCAPLCGVEEDVTVGWIFNMNTRAEYRYHPDHGHMVLLNPISVKETRITQFWANNRPAFYKLVSSVVHELTHFEVNGHGEYYAVKFTHNIAKVMKEYPRLEEIRLSTR